MLSINIDTTPTAKPTDCITVNFSLKANTPIATVHITETTDQITPVIDN